ncbi:MAG: hypothetical protein HY899_08575 [Deltaproteobacteria bacterium]|nr:hypothetical protein [Deltaproteobacteria bacterium]
MEVKPMKWEREDGAECMRLVGETAEDVHWQLQLFTSGITAPALALCVLARGTPATGTVVSPGLFYLVPLLVLVSSSLVILNRARARNRKAAFVIGLDYKRLSVAGVAVDTTPLTEACRRSDVPWETALHLLECTHVETQPRPHLPRALVYVTFASFFAEILLISLVVVEPLPRKALLILVAGVAALDVALIVYRSMAVFDLRGLTSIQGCAALRLRFPKRGPTRLPEYLVEWTDECEPLGRHPVFKV